MVIPPLVSALTHISSRARRWTLRASLGVVVVLIVFAVPVAIGTLLARPSANRGTVATENALTTVLRGRTSAGLTNLASASHDFSVAAQRAGSWWTAGGLLVPGVAQQRRAIVTAAQTGQTATAVAHRAAASVDINRLAFRHGRIDIARIRRLATPIGELQAGLASAQHRLTAIRSPWLVGPLRSRLALLGAKLTKARSSTALAAGVIRAAPGLLGGDGTRHYLIAFMTPSESRGLDGFIGAYGELRVDNGRLQLVRSGSVKELNRAKDGTRHITGPADYLARYGAFHPADFFQDLSYSPDFPTVEDVISQMYPQSGGDHIDGVIAIDPYALASLLAFTGPIKVPGLAFPLTSGNAAGFLLKGEYDSFGASSQARHDFLQEALATAFHRLIGGKFPAPLTLARQMGPDVRQGRLLFWTDRRSEQPVLRRLGVAGAFPRASGHDVLALTTQNAANNKIDAYFERRIDDRVLYDPATGQTTSTVTVTLDNTAPSTGLPAYVIGANNGLHLPAGTNRTWLSLYSPLNLTGATEGGKTLRVSPVRELGVNTYSTFVNVGPHGTATIQFRLTGQLKAGRTYQLSVRNQPMVNADKVTTEISPISGWTGSGASERTLAPDQAEIQTEVMTFKPTP